MTQARKGEHKSVSVLSIFFAICLAAFTTRLLPLSISQYPYNNDSLIECGMASEISESGHLDFSPGSPWYGTHSIATPALNVLLSFSSCSIGITPFDFAQLLTAIFFVLTAGGVFILARMMTGSARGGLTASIAAVTLGTYVFTTGSAWKVALGMSLFTLLFIAFVNRAQPRFRILTLLILLLLPLVHHLVAAIGYLAMSYFVAWGWFFAWTQSSVSKRHYLDTVTVMPPILIGLTYYATTLSDRLGMFSSPIRVVLFIESFILLALLSFVVLSLRSHVKWSFAPVVGIGMATLLFLDYSGHLFPYAHSASEAYVILILSSSFIVGFAWYGAEAMIERRPVYRAVMLGLLMPPVTVILFGFSMGLTGSSHQILYRAFDFSDLFVFMGLGFAAVIMSSRLSRKNTALVMTALVCLLVSFPFGYYTSDLLGVRHDTAAYEVDAVEWIASHSVSSQVVSDERIGRIAYSMTWVEKRSYLPQNLLANITPLPGMYYIMEDSWTDVGVNDYPYGRAVIPESLYVGTLKGSNVLYVGGPESDRLLIFYPSEVGLENWQL